VSLSPDQCPVVGEPPFAAGEDFWPATLWDKHGELPLVGSASDVRAVIGRSVDATAVDLQRDEVRKNALAEAVPRRQGSFDVPIAAPCSGSVGRQVRERQMGGLPDPGDCVLAPIGGVRSEVAEQMVGDDLERHLSHTPCIVTQ
jgi:hypothetical protein